MKPLGDERTHYLLAMGMAKATRTDLAQAMQTGELDNAGWARMIHRCRGCDWSGRCAEWLDDRMKEGAPCPPTCVNQRRFEDLRARSEQAREKAEEASLAATRAMRRAEDLRQALAPKNGRP